MINHPQLQEVTYISYFMPGEWCNVESAGRGEVGCMYLPVVLMYT